MFMKSYPPDRVNALLRKWDMIPGMSLDLTTNDPDDGRPWDFNDPDKAAKARGIIENKQVVLLIGSPMCTAFSSWQHLNFSKMTPEEVSERVSYGVRHLEFAIELYKMQINNGLHFLPEHPDRATSWLHWGIQRLLDRDDVIRVRGDMCRFGMTQHGDQ